MSKKEAQVLFQLISDFINGLNHEQYENLLNGKGTIEYKINNKFSPNLNLKVSLLKCKSIKEVERNFDGVLKKEIISFCECYEIDVKPKDTKGVIFQKIAAHFNIENQKVSQVIEKDVLVIVKDEFQKLISVEEAKKFLANNKYLKTKKDIIRFAKLFDVYISSRDSKEIILNRVIESVIGSRVRAKVIKEG